ncbi:hypothetical protein FRB94_009730 [Tulasnella sp. JGI-2019a]|nr:hypothetical protein FRB94_009730 [Tulasnella sp. JGI-2019a]
MTSTLSNATVVEIEHALLCLAIPRQVSPSAMAPKSKKASKAQDAAHPTKVALQPLPTPEWPPLNPLVPTTSLFLEPLVPSQIILLRNLFTSVLCARYTSFLSSLPLSTTPLTKSRDLALRINDRYQIDDPLFASRLWSQTALKDLVMGYEEQVIWGDGRGKDAIAPEILGLNPNIRVYRYRESQFFDKHYDDSNNLSFKSEDGRTLKAKTTWTLLIYLSVCEGGEMVFYPERQSGSKLDPEPVSVTPEVGLALLHRHGEMCMLHEGRKVTGGEKWVLRSDLVVGR